MLLEEIATVARTRDMSSDCRIWERKENFTVTIKVFKDIFCKDFFKDIDYSIM